MVLINKMFHFFINNKIASSKNIIKTCLNAFSMSREIVSKTKIPNFKINIYGGDILITNKSM